MFKTPGKPRWVYLVFFIGICSVIMRALLDSRFGTTSVTYILIPFIISFLLYHFIPPIEGGTRVRRVAQHFINATIVMLGTSVFIFEGFLCVLFFMPIYYLGVLFAYLNAVSADRSDRNRLKTSVVPLIVIIAAAEGLSPSTSFERQNSITRNVIISADIQSLQENMTQNIELSPSRHWMLSLFPLPQDIKAGSLKVGDIHKMQFIYKRWFFTNVKHGEFHLRLDKVSPEHIQTRVVKNDSYLASYMDIKGTDVHFKALGGGQTELSLTIHYDRKLDPYWYFGPLQKFTIEKSADYLIQNIIAKDSPIIAKGKL